MGLVYGSLFSGVGGIDLGFDRAGFEGAFQVEIDKACQRVLARHWPDVPRFGDVKDVTAGDIGSVDVLLGGFPCQDISLAGRRGGLAGERSGLFYEFIRLAAEVAPTWVLIENVPGLLSSNDGRDMGTVLASLGELGYGFAYRMLDAQYFGVAQRRRRVFIVGHLGAPWGSAVEVLLERDGLPWNPPPRRAQGATAAAGDPNSAGSPSQVATHEVSPCLQERGAKGADSDMTQAYVIDSSGIRRLTPLECERLQGFPDEWTAQESDSSRYEMMGNAVAVPVAEWIANRLRGVHERLHS